MGQATPRQLVVAKQQRRLERKDSSFSDAWLATDTVAEPVEKFCGPDCFVGCFVETTQSDISFVILIVGTTWYHGLDFRRELVAVWLLGRAVLFCAVGPNGTPPNLHRIATRGDTVQRSRLGLHRMPTRQPARLTCARLRLRVAGRSSSFRRGSWQSLTIRVFEIQSLAGPRVLPRLMWVGQAGFVVAGSPERWWDCFYFEPSLEIEVLQRPKARFHCLQGLPRQPLRLALPARFCQGFLQLRHWKN